MKSAKMCFIYYKNYSGKMAYDTGSGSYNNLSIQALIPSLHKIWNQILINKQKE